MVSATVSDTLFDPTRSLISLEAKLDPHQDFASYARDHFLNAFRDPSSLQLIPPLDVRHPPESHKDRALVRFRCMIQDTSASPELYRAQLTDGSNGGWGRSDDDTEENIDLNNVKFNSRTVVWAVNIPGENEWVSQTLDGEVTSQSDVTKGTPPCVHKYPLPNHPHVGAQIKVYDSSGEALKPAEVQTFVGIFTMEPLSVSFSAPEPPVVPTIHVFFHQTHPLTICDFPFPSIPKVVGDNATSARGVRSRLISWLSEEALGGDSDAAEWILLALVARVQSRNASLYPPSITLSSFPPPTSMTGSPKPTLLHILELLTPLSTYIPLSLPLLNESSFEPESKDEDLHSGWLQLPAGSTVCITDNAINEGKVNERGLRNLRALQQCLTSHTIDYIFPYSSYPFPIDFNVIVLTGGKKCAFIDTDVNVPLRPRKGNLYKPLDEVDVPPPDILESFRSLVGGAKTGDITVGEAVSSHIQEGFVRQRQNKEDVSPEDLLLRMLLARLMGSSNHERELSEEAWAEAKALDERRKARISQVAL